MKNSNPLLAAMGKTVKPELAQADVGKPIAELAPAKPVGKRIGQKHLGAYFDKGDPILERVAILSAAMMACRMRSLGYRIPLPCPFHPGSPVSS